MGEIAGETHLIQADYLRFDLHNGFMHVTQAISKRRFGHQNTSMSIADAICKRVIEGAAQNDLAWYAQGILNGQSDAGQIDERKAPAGNRIDKDIEVAIEGLVTACTRAEQRQMRNAFRLQLVRLGP